MRGAHARIAAAVAMLAVSVGSHAATVYSSPLLFSTAVGLTVTDDYQDPVYQEPDGGTLTDARMSEIFGQTQYHTTGLSGRSIVERQAGEAVYCAGCNGSFLLSFTATSLGDQTGVYGVSLNVIANPSPSPYVAFVTYGDFSTENVALPVVDAQRPRPPATFWGITSNKRIRSIHFGGPGGAPLTTGSFAIDNLTIGAASPVDTDADGVPDADDNCINEPNGPANPDAGGASQRDSDDDGYGNVCDGDLNNSGGIVNATDFALFRAAFATEDADADLNGSGGIVNVHDYSMFRVLFGNLPGPSGLVPPE